MIPNAVTYPDVDPLESPLLPFQTFADLCEEVDAQGPRQWLIRGIWPAGDYGVHGAEKKAQKTWNAIDLAVSVASGTPWLGTFQIDTPGPVIYFAGEGSKGNIVRRVRAVAAERGIDPTDLPLIVCARVPHLSDGAHTALMEDKIRRSRPVLVVIDPLYLAARGAKGADLYAMGELLEGPQHLCQAHGASLLVVTHFNRNPNVKGADRFTGAGPAEWGRILIAATVVSKRTDPLTKATTVVTKWEVIGGEIPDQNFRVRRHIVADDPDDLDSPLTYTVSVHDDDDPPAVAEADLPPAALKLLEALDDSDGPAGIKELVDRIADRYGNGLKRPTCSTHLNKLHELGLVDFLEPAPGAERLWLRVRPELREAS